MHQNSFKSSNQPSRSISPLVFTAGVENPQRLTPLAVLLRHKARKRGRPSLRLLQRLHYPSRVATLWRERKSRGTFLEAFTCERAVPRLSVGALRWGWYAGQAMGFPFEVITCKVERYQMEKRTSLSRRNENEREHQTIKQVGKGADVLWLKVTVQKKNPHGSLGFLPF